MKKVFKGLMKLLFLALTSPFWLCLLYRDAFEDGENEWCAIYLQSVLGT